MCGGGGGGVLAFCIFSCARRGIASYELVQSDVLTPTRCIIGTNVEIFFVFFRVLFVAWTLIFLFSFSLTSWYNKRLTDLFVLILFGGHAVLTFFLHTFVLLPRCPRLPKGLSYVFGLCCIFYCFNAFRLFPSGGCLLAWTHGTWAVD